MSETQFYVLCAIPLVGILLNGGLFIYLGGRVDNLVNIDPRLKDKMT